MRGLPRVPCGLNCNPLPIGATTRLGLLTTPLRDRFGIPTRLQFYTEDELYQIVSRNARKLGAPRMKEAHAKSHGVRVAHRALRGVYCAVLWILHWLMGTDTTKTLADHALTRLSVDDLGLMGRIGVICA